MEGFALLLKSLPGLIKAKASTLIIVALISSVTVIANKDYLNNLLFKKDLTKEYMQKTYIIERDLNLIRNLYKAENGEKPLATVFLLHNGITTFNNMHIMRFTMMFGSGDKNEVIKDKMIYVNQPLSPWIDNCRKMIEDGHYYIRNSSRSKDPLEQALYYESKKKSLIYIPLYKKTHLIGFLSLGYVSLTSFTEKDLKAMERSAEIVEAHLK